MVSSVNFCQNIQIPQKLAFKGKQEQILVSNPVETSNLNGVDALASYNVAFMQKPKDIFDIPLVKPVEIPKDFNSIDGEKIYNSKGILQCIVKETGDKKYVYRTHEDEITLDVINKNTGNKVFRQNEWFREDGKTQSMVVNYDKNTGKEIAGAQFRDGKLLCKHSTWQNKDGEEELISFDPDIGYEYYCKGSNNTNYVKYYDIDKNLIREEIYEHRADGYNEKEIKYSSGKPMITEIKEVRGKFSKKYSSYLKDPNLKRAEIPEVITSIDNIAGEKTYYSNGQLESVRTPDGKLYEQTLDGECITVTDGNKTTKFCKEHYPKSISCSIEEDLGNATKSTHYFDIENNKRGNVTYTKGNISKFVYFDKNGNATNYEEKDVSKDYKDSIILDVHFAQNGSVIKVNKSFDEIMEYQ